MTKSGIACGMLWACGLLVAAPAEGSAMGIQVAPYGETKDGGAVSTH